MPKKKPSLKQRSSRAKQANQFDKIFKENIQHALPGLIKNLLGINVVKSEELVGAIQRTTEREPDVLTKITDDKNKTFVLQLEFQVRNDREMAYRMYEYHAMLVRKYKIPVKQYVVYLGEGANDDATQPAGSGPAFQI
jgi:hypothetical protein